MNMRMCVCLIAAAWLVPASAAPAPSAKSPSHIHSGYAVLKSGIEIGKIDEVFTRTVDHYTLTSTATPIGLLALFKPGKIIIHSAGLITHQGLQPQQFSYQREGDSGKNNDAEFDWNNAQLTLNHDGQHSVTDLPRGTQDRLSAMYQFMFLNFREMRTLDFAMTNGSKLDSYHYVIGDGGTLVTAAGSYATVTLDSQAKTGETRTQVWLASARYNLPCKLIITDPDGGKLTQELRALDIQP